jgi:hypothetical protein
VKDANDLKPVIRDAIDDNIGCPGDEELARAIEAARASDARM